MPKTFYLPPNRLEQLLDHLGIVVVGGSAKELIAYCPFHANRDTPAFNISLAPPHPWRCHNASCNKRGKRIFSLLTLKGYEPRDAERMLLKGTYEINDLVSVIERLMEDALRTDSIDTRTEWDEVDVQCFQNSDERNDYRARKYFQSRGIGEDAYAFFHLGYSHAKDMAVIPIFDERGGLSGVIGREIQTKRYQYSTGLRRSELVWNVHNAKRCGDMGEYIILTEGALDSVYIWQAGYPNVGAVLGSAISPKQWDSIRRNFAGIVCFFDNDDAGNALRDSIIENVKDLAVWVVQYPDRMITYVEDGEEKQRPIKDPGELTTEEIQFMLHNKRSSIEMLLSGVSGNMIDGA